MAASASFVVNISPQPGTSADMDLGLTMEMATLTGYQCSKGCNQVFYSECSRINHEYFECPNSIIGFNDNISSPQNTEVTIFTELQPASPSTSYNLLEPNGLFDPSNVIFHGVAEEVEVHDTPNQQQPTNMQQHSCGITAERLLSSRRSNKKPSPDLSQIFDATPVTATIDTGLPTKGMKKYIQENCTKTLLEINSRDDSMGGQLEFNETMHSTMIQEIITENDFEKTIADIFLDDDFVAKVIQELEPPDSSSQSSSDGYEDPYALKLNIMEEEENIEWPFIPIGTKSQPVLDKFTPNLLNILTQESIPHHPPQTPKKGKGRPRKDQSKCDIEKQKIELQTSVHNSYMNDTLLPDRRCKATSLKKIRSSISEESTSGEGSTSGASDDDYSLKGLEGSRKRVRTTPRRYQEDPDYEDIKSDSSDTPSHISQTDADSEDLLNLNRRKKNNAASKKSRLKRKELDQAKESECKELENRFTSLSIKAAKLEAAVQTIMKHLASVKRGV